MFKGVYSPKIGSALLQAGNYLKSIMTPATAKSISRFEILKKRQPFVSEFPRGGSKNENNFGEKQAHARLNCYQEEVSLVHQFILVDPRLFRPSDNGYLEDWGRRKIPLAKRKLFPAGIEVKFAGSGRYCDANETLQSSASASGRGQRVIQDGGKTSPSGNTKRQEGKQTEGQAEHNIQRKLTGSGF